MLGRNQSLSKSFFVHQLANGALKSHLKSNDLFQRHIEYRLTILDVAIGVNSPVVLRVVPQLELAVVRTSRLHPVEKILKSLALWMIRCQLRVLLDLLQGALQQHFEINVVWVDK